MGVKDCPMLLLCDSNSLTIHKIGYAAGQRGRRIILSHPSIQNVKTAICYIRKSREDEQAERRGEDTLAKQREMLCNDVLSRYTFHYEIAEEVASGDSIRDRPVFRKLLHDLGLKYQAIVCKDLSRLGRGSYSDMGIVYDIIRDKRIYIITKDAIYDPHNFSDLRMIRFSLFFNREEYEMTLWRLTEGKYDGAQRGRWVAGSVPYGYKYDRQNQTLIPNENERHIIKLVFDWYTKEQIGYQAIAKRLTELGITTSRGKSKWHSEVIRRMLRNPAYCGTLAFRLTQRSKLDGKITKRPIDEQIIVEDAFEPLIDNTTWTKAATRLQAKGYKPATTIESNRSELAGLITCDTCHTQMIRQSSTKTYQRRDGSPSKYHHEFLYCKECGYAVKYRDCEQQIMNVLSHIPLPSQSVLDAMYRIINSSSTKSIDSNKTNISMVMARQLIARKETLEKRLDRARDMLLDGVFSKAEYEKVYRQLEREFVQIKEAMSRLNEQPVYAQAEISESIQALKIGPFQTLFDVYAYLSTSSLKNQLLQSTLKRVQLKRLQKQKKGKAPTQFQLAIWMK